jgi:hypothetical protein
MTTKKQVKANRANARLSTGPRTKNGKKRSRMNALTHGLTAEKILIPGETEEQFDELLQGLIDDFTPGTTIECE